MAVLSFARDILRLRRAEGRLKRGEITPEEFLDAEAEMGHSEDAFRFLRATVLVVLHMPLIQLLFWLGVVTVVPLLAVFFASSFGRIRLLFGAYIVLRLLVAVQDVQVMRKARSIGSIPFNSGLTSTILGTLPYRKNYVIGPLAFAAGELLLYGGLASIPTVLVELQGLLADVAPAVMAVGILQVVWHTTVRAGVNVMISYELPHLADPGVLHRIRRRTWRWKNLLLGRGAAGQAEVDRAGRLWADLQEDLTGPGWDDLDALLADLDDGARRRTKRYLLASRKDEVLVRSLKLRDDGEKAGGEAASAA